MGMRNHPVKEPFASGRSARDSRRGVPGRGFRRLFLAVLPALLWGVLGIPSPVAAKTQEIWVTLPQLAMVARFIGGVNATVRSTSVWDGAGRIVPAGRPAPGVPLIALCPEDAASRGIKPDRRNLRFLYSRFPLPLSQTQSLFFDPAALPFVGVRLLNALSGLDPKNYPYYQRRLAEFQSRLESTLQMGRELLSPIPALDLTGVSSGWIRAAMPKLVRPPENLWNAWRQGGDMVSLGAAVAEARQRGWMILADFATPAPIRDRAAAAGGFLVPPPRTDQEFFLYLYDQYLNLQNYYRGGKNLLKKP
jgi:hypothetical protein